MILPRFGGITKRLYEGKSCFDDEAAKRRFTDEAVALGEGGRSQVDRGSARIGYHAKDATPLAAQVEGRRPSRKPGGEAPNIVGGISSGSGVRVRAVRRKLAGPHWVGRVDSEGINPGHLVGAGHIQMLLGIFRGRIAMPNASFPCAEGFCDPAIRISC